ncbi:MAG: aminotransferase class I/II-fold pyridoxal phosphate-dependent enzyme, partial [Candidatus Acidiferrum sp.]
MPDDVLSAWKATLGKGLQTLDEQHQRRTLAQIHGIDFCSNDYLGLAEHPALREAVVRAVQNSTRVGGTASRLLSGQTEGWRKLEEEFAGFAGTEAALFFGSGYAANMGLLSALVGRDDVVYSDVLNHASLIDGMRLSGARKVIYP